MNWSEIVIAVVAAYGAILSTYTVIAKHKATKPSVKVKMSEGVIYLGDTISPPLLFVSASNVGQKTVELTSWGIKLPNKVTLWSRNPVYRDERLPHELLPGRSTQTGGYMGEFAQSAKEEGYSGDVKVRGFYRDAVGTEYWSRPFRFSVPKWIQCADASGELREN